MTAPLVLPPRQIARRPLPGAGGPIGGDPLMQLNAQLARQAQPAQPAAPPPLDPQQQQQQAMQGQQKKGALKAQFGSDFPLVQDHEPLEMDWVRWMMNLYSTQRAGMTDALAKSERNRLFRNGIQWLSLNANRGQWREPPMPKDAVRAVDNQIGPGLDWAIQIMREQRPGWRFQPANHDPDRRQKAEAQQLGVEYQWHTQKMRDVMAEAVYWAQTDGVSFLYTYWNPEKGPWESLQEGQATRPTGDCETCVLRIEQVRVSPNATMIKPPKWWVIRETIPLQDAVNLYGAAVDDEVNGAGAPNASIWNLPQNPYQTNPLFIGNKTVERYTALLEPCEDLPGGLLVITVGKRVVVGPRDLPIGCANIVPVRDGSTDPKFFPAPKVDGLVGPQMRVNMLLSKWIENVRANAGGRYLGKSGALVTETFTGGLSSVMEVRSGGPINETIMPVAGFSIGDDTKELLQLETKKIEDRSGWNDTARGQFTNDASGRAILAIREQLERTFAPMVYATAEAYTQWAEQQVLWMRWGYQMPRMLAVTGTNRPDLARSLSSQDFDGAVDCFVDPETLMPKPFALRLYLLNDALDRQAITPEEWRKRSQFADTDDFQTPDEVQEARAKRIADQMRTGQPVEPMLWQDNEAIHQDILEHEIILIAGVTPQALALAQQRWDQLAQQAAMKQGGGMPGQPPMGALGSGPPADPSAPAPMSQMPGVASGPIDTAPEVGQFQTDQGRAASMFERMAPQ